MTEPAGIDWIFHSLQDEARQLRDLLPLLKQGHTHHARGISSRIRLLIISRSNKTPMPLLRMCAAVLDEPLIIYTAAQPHLKLPSDLPVPNHHISFNGSHVRLPLYRNPVDVDVWLDLWAANISGTYRSSRELLKTIGDTIGSHLDVYVDPSTPALRSTRIALSGVELDALASYLLRAGEICLALSEQVLRVG